MQFCMAVCMLGRSISGLKVGIFNLESVGGWQRAGFELPRIIRPPSRSRKPLRLAEDILRLASRLAG